MSIIFKGTLTVYLSIAITTLGLLSFLLIQPPLVYAEEDTTTPTVIENPVEETEEITGVNSHDSEIETEIPKIQFGTYAYQAQKGDNLTYLARRSVQLYLPSSKLNLETSQIIAAETLIVRELGSFELFVGQEVEIDVSLVGRSVYEAYLLDEATKMRWSAYEPIRESLDHIVPLSIPRSLNFENDETVEEEPNNDDDEAQITTDPLEVDNTVVKDDSSSYIVLFGVLILIGIVVWVLALTFLRNTKEDGTNEAWEEDDKKKLKEKITNSKLATKIKTLPKELDKQKEKLKKKSSKPKKVRKKTVKRKK